MSWSVSYIGSPEKVCAALDDYSTKLSGQSKEEFDEVLPNLKSLVSMNIGGQAIRLSANGHATIADGVKTYSHLGCEIVNLGRILI